MIKEIPLFCQECFFRFWKSNRFQMAHNFCQQTQHNLEHYPDTKFQISQKFCPNNQKNCYLDLGFWSRGQVKALYLWKSVFYKYHPIFWFLLPGRICKLQDDSCFQHCQSHSTNSLWVKSFLFFRAILYNVPFHKAFQLWTILYFFKTK